MPERKPAIHHRLLSPTALRAKALHPLPQVATEALKSSTSHVSDRRWLTTTITTVENVAEANTPRGSEMRLTPELKRSLPVLALLFQGACTEASPPPRPPAIAARAPASAVAPALPPPPAPVPQSNPARGDQKTIISFGDLTLHTGTTHCREKTDGSGDVVFRTCDYSSGALRRDRAALSSCIAMSSVDIVDFRPEVTRPAFGVFQCGVQGESNELAFLVADQRFDKDLNGMLLGASTVLGWPGVDEKALQDKFDAAYGLEQAVQATKETLGVSSPFLGSDVKFCDGSVCNEGWARMDRAGFDRQGNYKSTLLTMKLVDLTALSKVKARLKELAAGEAAGNTKQALDAIK